MTVTRQPWKKSTTESSIARCFDPMANSFPQEATIETIDWNTQKLSFDRRLPCVPQKFDGINSKAEPLDDNRGIITWQSCDISERCTCLYFQFQVANWNSACDSQTLKLVSNLYSRAIHLTTNTQQVVKVSTWQGGTWQACSTWQMTPDRTV